MTNKDFILPTPKVNNDVFFNNNLADIKLSPVGLKAPQPLMAAEAAGASYVPPSTFSKAAVSVAPAAATTATLKLDEDELMRAICRTAAAAAAAGGSVGNCSSVCSCSGVGECDACFLLLDGSNPRYKTEMCRNFKEKARCVYGDQCQFAHGRRELREVVRNSKYKTKHCQKYWVTGYCAYGPRCNFLHNEISPEEEQQLMFRQKLRSTSSMTCPTSRCSVSSEGSLTPPEQGQLDIERSANKKARMLEPLVLPTNTEESGDIFSGMERWNNKVVVDDNSSSFSSKSSTPTQTEP